MLMAASDSPDPARFRETELFRKCREMGIIPASEDDLIRRNAKETDPAPDLSDENDRDDLLDLNLSVSGMWCPACAWIIDETLKKIPGVSSVSTHFSTDRLRCRYDPVQTAPNQVIRHIEKLGYTAALPGDGGTSEKKRETLRFAISAIFTMNVMMLSWALYSGFFTTLSGEAIRNLSCPIFVMATVPFFYGGLRIHRRAWAGFLSASLSMEALISVASGSAFLYSLLNLFRGSIHLYFDTASMLISLTLLGKLLERNARDKVLADLETFFSLQPTKVRLCPAHIPQGRYVAIEMLEKGDMFIVDENEIVPADGRVVEGRGAVDESALTGEALPVTKTPGGLLRSGTRVIRGPFRVRADATGEASTLGQMIRIIEKTLNEKTAFEGKTDIVLQWFVPVILTLATGTGLVCFFMGLSPEVAMIRAITVMVISCPCALGIAIPLARVSGISAAGRSGLLVREFSCFEQAARIDTFVFDKTGTLTCGQYVLREIIPLGPSDENEVLALAVALEQHSDHYLAIEIRNAARKAGIAPAELTSEKIFENGIAGYLPGTGEVRIGAREFVAETADVEISDSEAECSTLYMSVAGKPAACLVFGDTLRDGAKPAVRALSDAGHGIVMISGDAERTTAAIGRQVGIEECYGGRLPADKAEFVRSLQQNGAKVAMIGDGINDAPALVQADISIAVHSGGHLGKETADITLMRSDPRQILFFLGLARRVNRKICQNLACSFVYNILSIPIAMSGLLTPLVAVTAMLMSSLTVIGNTLLLIRRSDRPGPDGL
ncbi:copper-translocating P-type ATPase [Desulfonema ishimotonii]|uniref:Copper-translocating P-type ATPase n=1 Tax=Desulfonema ishimotonii TaxID=45657 RepID=A0A401FS25_9BACT|nr:cation-translocating P-type ATPase [Desulfonema ishimotonii]GBC59750.1 copper-translocating P-type ATPase [Desulfonema ishimotonii]